MKITSTSTSDGINIKGLLSEPSQKTSKIIVHIHGMSGDIYTNSFYPFMHEQYPQNGIAFLAGEHRGTHSITQFGLEDGSFKNFGNTYEIFEDCVHDIQGWVDKVKELGYKNIWLQAHSLGPSKVTYYMNQSPDEKIKGLIYLSPSDMLGLVNTPDEKAKHMKRLENARRLIQDNKPHDILEDDLWGEMKLSAQTYVNFFDNGAHDAIFNYAAPELGWGQVNNLNLPIIAFTGTQDDGIVPVVDAHKAMKILESELKNSPRKKTVVYENAAHDFEGFGDQIVKEVIEFVSEE